MFARFCIFSLILIGAATVLSVRAAGPGTHAPRPVHARQRPRGESRCIGAQPAPLRQHPVENQPARRAAHALPDALRKTRARHHDERPRHRREPPAGTLRRENHRRHHHRTPAGFRPRRQPARTHGQQNPHAHPRPRRPARPAVPLGRQARPAAHRAQQAADPLARLHLGHRRHGAPPTRWTRHA